MTKAEFIDRIKGVEGGPELTKKQAGLLLDAFFGILQESIVKDKRFSYPGFGTFHVKQRKARPGRNPRTKKVIQIPASKTVTFKAAPSLKGALKK
jgi:DNA-binding protein HU-beta